MKLALIAYIALGLSLSMILGIKYECTGMDVFPRWYGSPFIFMQSSLATSLEHYYSISGVFLNTTVWSGGLLFMEKVFRNLAPRNRVFKIIKALIVSVLLLFSSASLAITYTFMGQGFGEGSNSNAWYWDIDQEADKWGMTCEGQIEFISL